MTFKRKKMIFGYVLLFLIFLNKFTVVNITSASIFKKKEYNNYSYLKNGIESEHYQIKRISEEPYSAIVYDPLDNFFIVYGPRKIQKISTEGKEEIEFSNSNDVTYTNFGHYVFTDTTAYDLSEKIVKSEKLKEVISPTKDLSSEDLLTLFEGFYRKASVVIYGNYE